MAKGALVGWSGYTMNHEGKRGESTSLSKKREKGKKGLR